MVDDVRSRTRSSCQANYSNGEKDKTIDSSSKGGSSRRIQRAYQGTITVFELLELKWDQLRIILDKKNTYQINKSVFYEVPYKFPETSRKMYENN